jgi:hypothetical protein
MVLDVASLSSQSRTRVPAAEDCTREAGQPLVRIDGFISRAQTAIPPVISERACQPLC